MELTLNLLWLMLAVPVVVLLWHAPESAMGARKHSRLYLCVFAACLLALLFPVVSASDDLNAMRVELDESGSAQSTIKSAASDSPHSQYHSSSLVAVLCPLSPGFESEACGEISPSSQVILERVTSNPLGERAPPLS
jgi:hypothetical protein